MGFQGFTKGSVTPRKRAHGDYSALVTGGQREPLPRDRRRVLSRFVGSSRHTTARLVVDVFEIDVMLSPGFGFVDESCELEISETDGH